MKVHPKSKIFFLAIMALVATACEKTGGSGRIEIFAEPMDAAKVRVGDVDSVWVDGDKILVNSDEVEVERRGGHAYINYGTPLSVNRAVYPASIASGTLSGDAATVTLPGVYHYCVDANGYQLLELPMAARSEGEEALRFKHLTGALCFIVKNDGATEVTLQSLTVSSNDGYRLSGSCSIDFSDLEGTSAEKTGVAADRKVTLLFDNGHVLASGDEVRVTVPVPPVGSDNHFNVQVRLYHEGDDHSYLYNRSQPSGGALNRNQLGYSNVGVTASNGEYVSPTSLLTVANGTCHIGTARDFQLWYTAIENDWSFQGGTYRTAPCCLDNDIDLTGVIITPIITYGGELDGNGHSINNLTIQSINTSAPADTKDHYCGLFVKSGKRSIVKNLTLDNLSLKHTTYTSANLYLGAFYANIEKSSGSDTTSFAINGCNANITSITKSEEIDGHVYIGGLVGSVSKPTTITNCHVTIPAATIEGSRNVYFGGLVGSNSGNSATDIRSSSWTGSVYLSSGINMWAGGLLANKTQGDCTINNCTVEGTINASVTGNYKYLASLIGRKNSTGTVSISSTTPNVSVTLNNSVVSPVPEYNN